MRRIHRLHKCRRLPIQRSFTSTPSKELILYNSLTFQHQPIPSNILWYTCGPTVYDSCHLGHGRTYMMLDLIRRVAPPGIRYIMNITDVDDKILNRARDTGMEALELARGYEEEFWMDMDALNILKPHVIVRVSEHVEDCIIPYIQKILDRGAGYVIEGEGVYFSVRYGRYGKLLEAPPQARDFHVSGEEHHKRDQRDFALWKNRPESLSWDSPWGRGRPGWHIECSAMFDAISSLLEEIPRGVHAGGIDLKFPHHVNEIAQAEAFHGWGEWVPHWVHTGHLHIDGAKMSKSLKNFITVRGMLEERGEGEYVCPADDFRLWCLGLAGHYRGPATFSYHGLDQARSIRYKIVEFIIQAQQWISRHDKNTRQKTRKWNPSEIHLFQFTNETMEDAYLALMGSNNPNHAFDFDGTTYLHKLLSLVEYATKYLHSFTHSTHTTTAPPTECLQYTLSTLQSTLHHLGFSNATVHPTSSQNFTEKENLAVVDELVRFRSSIRQIMLGDENIPKETREEILKLCDVLRDRRLPSLGYQIFDAASADSWTRCIPKAETSSTPSKTEEMKVDVPLKDLFRESPKYQNRFSAFDEEGLPTHLMDGTPISKSMRKKLVKKSEKYRLRLEKKHKNE